MYCAKRTASTCQVFSCSKFVGGVLFWIKPRHDFWIRAAPKPVFTLLGIYLHIYKKIRVEFFGIGRIVSDCTHNDSQRRLYNVTLLQDVICGASLNFESCNIFFAEAPQTLFCSLVVHTTTLRAAHPRLCNTTCVVAAERQPPLRHDGSSAS